MIKRITFLLPFLLLMLSLATGRAEASCAGLSLKEQADLAESVIYGQVERVNRLASETYYTVTVERVYKGEPSNPIVIHSESGWSRTTSVDLPMKKGEAYTLFLRRDATQRLTTDECSGSHSGEPTAEDVAQFGEGRPAPERSQPTPSLLSVIPILLVGGIGVAGLAYLIRRRPHTKA